MFTNYNTNGLYSNDLLDEMNAALEHMLGDETDEYLRYQNERNYSDRIMEIAEEGMTAAEIITAAVR